MKSIALSTLLLLTGHSVANQVSDMVAALSEADQRQKFTQLLHASGKGCGSATRVFYRGVDSDDAAYWSVRCSNGADYNVQLPADPNANSRILECSALKAIGVDCWALL